MKAINTIIKILAALAAVAGAVYVIATYGDKIVAWAKKLLNCTCECCCGEDDCCCGEDDCCCGEECCCEAEETVTEEAPAAEETPAAEEDFEV